MILRWRGKDYDFMLDEIFNTLSLRKGELLNRVTEKVTENQAHIFWLTSQKRFYQKYQIQQTLFVKLCWSLENVK